MFQHGASDKEKIETYMYPPEYEDFAGGKEDRRGHQGQLLTLYYRGITIRHLGV